MKTVCEKIMDWNARGGKTRIDFHELFRSYCGELKVKARSMRKKKEKIIECIKKGRSASKLVI